MSFVRWGNQKKKLREEYDELRHLVSRQQEMLEKQQDRLNEQQECIQHLERQANNDIFSSGHINYEDFCNTFRGSREDIKNRLKQYIKFFEGKNNVLDIGCGRGEFLELLREHQIVAEGVDLYPPFVEMCVQLGLNVKCNDGIEHIKTKSTWDGIFASQVIEHMEFRSVLQLCKEAYDRLEPDSYLVLETPNPTKLDMYTNSFYIDPTHTKPIHPATLLFVLEKTGFSDCGLIFTEESKYLYNIPMIQSDAIVNLEEVNHAMSVLNDFLFGSMDYAVYGRK